MYDRFKDYRESLNEDDAYLHSLKFFSRRIVETELSELISSSSEEVVINSCVTEQFLRFGERVALVYAHDEFCNTDRCALRLVYKNALDAPLRGITVEYVKDDTKGDYFIDLLIKIRVRLK